MSLSVHAHLTAGSTGMLKKAASIFTGRLLSYEPFEIAADQTEITIHGEATSEGFAHAAQEAASRLKGVSVALKIEAVPSDATLPDEPTDEHPSPEDPPPATGPGAFVIQLSGAPKPELVAAGQALCQALAGKVTFTEPPTGWDEGKWCIYGETDALADVRAAASTVHQERHVVIGCLVNGAPAFSMLVLPELSLPG